MLVTSAPATISYVNPVPPPQAVVPVEQSPLSAEHLRQMSDARLRAKKVRRCVSVANFDGWSVGAFGGLTLLFGMFSFWGWFLGAGMLISAYVELTTVSRVKRLEPNAARRLGWNQIALAGLLLTYAGWSLYQSVYGPDLLASAAAEVPEAADMLAPYSGLARMISVAVYVGLACVAVFAQGGTALYYFSREKHIRAYREQTPAWIVEMQQQSGAPL
jgi:hypothetical protein